MLARPIPKSNELDLLPAALQALEVDYVGCIEARWIFGQDRGLS